VKAHDDKSDDLRLIEDYLPIEAISAEASRRSSAIENTRSAVEQAEA
jgi:hypothetical protein